MCMVWHLYTISTGPLSNRHSKRIQWTDDFGSNSVVWSICIVKITWSGMLTMRRRFDFHGQNLSYRGFSWIIQRDRLHPEGLLTVFLCLFSCEFFMVCSGSCVRVCMCDCITNTALYLSMNVCLCVLSQSRLSLRFYCRRQDWRVV